MHRFYLPSAHGRENTLTLPEREAHHAARVLRLRPGDPVTILNGRGTVCQGELTSITPHQAQVSLRETRQIPPPACPLTLLQAIPKGKTFDTIIQKATELGAAQIIPLLTDRVLSRLDPAQAQQRRQKWEVTAVEAIKQCGAPWLPAVAIPASPDSLLAHPQRFDLSLVAALSPLSRHPSLRFQDFQARHGRLPSSVAIWVGPEGDFTPAELASILDSGAQPVTLGNLVLRADTAAIYSLSFLHYELSKPGRT